MSPRAQLVYYDLFIYLFIILIIYYEIVQCTHDIQK